MSAVAGALAAARPMLLARIFLPLAAGYFLSYLFRTINAVIAPQLVAEFHLSASALGLLTSAYFIAFAGMQIPAGLLLDRFGPRRVQSSLLFIAALGSLLFALSESASGLAVARALIGAGVAASLMASFSAFVLWLPPARVPAASGLMMAFGGLGAFVAGSPAEMLLGAGISWRTLFLWLAGASVLAAVVMLIVMPEGGAGRRENARDLLVGLGRIFANRLFWGVAPLSIASCGSAFALQGLWAGPWLGQVAHLPPAEIGYYLSAMALALLAGSLACGPLTAAAARVGLSLLGTVAALGLCFIAALAGLVLQLTQLSLVLWAALGFLTNPMSMGYLAVAGRFPPTMAGRVTTAMNALVLAGSFVVQTFIGAVLDLWRPIAPGVYPPEAFQASFATIWLAAVLAWIWLVLSIRKGQWRAAEKEIGAPPLDIDGTPNAGRAAHHH